MTSPSPRVTIARPSRSNGLLSIPASATQRKNSSIQDTHSRASSARLKIVIRRLPPGLTQTEFEEALGDQWKVGGNKVDWATYKPGKVSKDLAKPSRPSRAYLHLTKQEHITTLSEHIRNTTFTDSKGSLKDSSLLGVPSIEFAPYGRVPNSRSRKDARQGTIDQDPEFIDFLESLTNPISKQSTVDQENDGIGKAKEKVTVTPLVQFLRDKKANKVKENSAPTKSTKHTRQDSKDGKATNGVENKSVIGNTTVSPPKKRSAQAVKVEQAARDAVKVLSKQATTTNKGTKPTTSSPSAPVPKQPLVTPNSTGNAALADKKRERGNASAAAKILQRDLGLGGGPAGRGGRRGQPTNVERGTAANTVNASKVDTSVSQSNPLSPSQSDPPQGSAADTAVSPNPTKHSMPRIPVGPAASRLDAPLSNSAASTITSGTVASPPKATPAPSTAKQAFLKHANPSQGITEPLLEEAFTAFGAVAKVEIDKKKGFAYVDFVEPESLQKAVRASPIKVAQGQVVVLERKSGPNLQARNIRGGGSMMGSRGGGMPLGGRGASMRGRGGYARGGINMPTANNTRPIPPVAMAAPKPAPASTQIPSTTTTGEDSTAPSSNVA